VTTAPADIRLLVSDVDGTLVNHDKQLTEVTIAAVARLRTAGIGFAMISARPRSGVVPLAATLGIDDPIAAFNGGTLFRRSGEVIERHIVPADLAQDVLATAQAAGATLWMFADDRWYASNDTDPHTDRERRSTFQEPTVVSDFTALTQDVDKITIVSDDAALLDDLTDRLRAAHGAAATIARSQPYYLDVTARAANKGDGIEALAGRAGVPLTAVAAIGDQANDLPMLERAGLAIAMGQAPEAVKAAADWITDDNDADGVAVAIDRLLAGR
jgi:Cof subfamily protein (haloacid dehalogenase superfamily)